MSLLVADTDELRRLASEHSTTRARVERAQGDVDDLLRRLDWRGWNAGDVEGRANQAREEVRRVLDSLSHCSHYLQRKAALLDELTGRPWPGVFGVATASWLDKVEQWVKIAKPATQMLEMVARIEYFDATHDLTAWRKFLDRRLSTSLGRLTFKLLGGTKRGTIATLLRFLRWRPGADARTSLGRVLHSPAYRSAIGEISGGLKYSSKVLTVAYAVLDFGVTFSADTTETDLGRRLLGALASTGTKMAILFGVGALAASSSPVVAVVGLTLVVGLPVLSLVTGKQELDVVGTITERAGKFGSGVGKGVYDFLQSRAVHKVYRVQSLGGGMARGGDQHARPTDRGPQPDLDRPADGPSAGKEVAPGTGTSDQALGMQLVDTKSSENPFLKRYWGECTYWAWERYHQVTGESAPFRSDAGNWPNEQHAGWETSTEPRPGSFVIIPPYSYVKDGVSQQAVGHVAYVEWVNADGTFAVSEMNRMGNHDGPVLTDGYPKSYLFYRGTSDSEKQRVLSNVQFLYRSSSK